METCTHTEVEEKVKVVVEIYTHKAVVEKEKAVVVTYTHKAEEVMHKYMHQQTLNLHCSQEQLQQQP